jgi:hypothetical protein
MGSQMPYRPETRLHFPNIKISINTKDLTDNDHGKTISELRVRESDKTLTSAKTQSLTKFENSRLLKTVRLQKKRLKPYLKF